MNQRGSSLLTALFSMLALMSLLAYLKISLGKKTAAIIRAHQTALCHKKALKKVKSSMIKINSFNTVIRTAQLAKLSAATAAKAMITIKASRKSQEIIHSFMLSSILKDQHCLQYRLTKPLSSPYKTKGFFKLSRRADGTTYYRSSNWKLRTTDFKNKFTIVSTIKTSSSFSLLIKTESKFVSKQNYLFSARDFL